MGYALARVYALTRDMLPVTLRSSIRHLQIALRLKHSTALGVRAGARIRADARYVTSYIAICASIEHLQIALRFRYVQARRVTASEVCSGELADARYAASYIAICASIKHLQIALRFRYVQARRVTTSEVCIEARCRATCCQLHHDLHKHQASSRCIALEAHANCSSNN